MNSISRKLFLKNATLAAIPVLAGAQVLTSCSIAKSTTGKGSTGFVQLPLPYKYNALDRAIDPLTMDIHYSRHAAAYATNLRDAAQNEGVDMKKPLENVLARISKYSTKMRNNGGGHYNHELFWKCMSPDASGKPVGKLLTAIEESFNSFESFKNQFADAGKNQFGSGWAWLYVDKDKKLKIGSTANQDNPLMDVSPIKGTPLLGLDVWEHAYYLRYQNKRIDYINAWWSVVNWDFVSQRLTAAI